MERLNRRNKEMAAGTPAPATTTNKVSADGGLFNTISEGNSIQAKPKKSLMDDINLQKVI